MVRPSHKGKAPRFATVRLFFCLSAAALALTACGYSMGNAPVALKERFRTLAVSEVRNPSLEPSLSQQMRTFVRDELTRRGGVTWVDRSEAKGLVEIDIDRYYTRSGLSGYHDETLRLEAIIHARLRILSSEDGRVVWDSGKVEVGEPFYFGQEAEVRAEVAELAARRLADRLLQNY